MLNKFPVIPNHFILATKENKRQTHVLEQDDLEATYACLKAWEEGVPSGTGTGRGRLFAFFNSGDYSGASQPHRHLQFLPVNSMHEGEKSSGWDLLVDSVVEGATKGRRTVYCTTPTASPLLCCRFSYRPLSFAPYYITPLVLPILLPSLILFDSLTVPYLVRFSYRPLSFAPYHRHVC